MKQPDWYIEYHDTWWEVKYYTSQEQPNSKEAV